MVAESAQSPRRGRIAVAATWLLALAATVAVVAVVRSPDAQSWLGVVLTLAVVAAFAGQLAAGEQRGFLVRLAAACTGAFGVVLLGAVAAALLG